MVTFMSSSGGRQREKVRGEGHVFVSAQDYEVNKNDTMSPKPVAVLGPTYQRIKLYLTQRHEITECKDVLSIWVQRMTRITVNPMLPC